MNSQINKNNWNDSMHIFFSPKLSLDNRNMLPQLVDSALYHRQQNFLTVFKKPLINVYDKYQNAHNHRNPRLLIHNLASDPIHHKNNMHTNENSNKKYVQVIGENKNFEKRNHTTNNKKNRKQISPQIIEEEILKNYEDALAKAADISLMPHGNAKKRMSQFKIFNPEHRHLLGNKKDGDEYYYFIGAGNNSSLVQEILSRRNNWSETSKDLVIFLASSLFHFRWQQIRPRYHNNPIQKQLYNHLPNHEMISDKVNLVKSLKLYCEKNEEEMFRVIPVCFQFDFLHPEKCENEIKKFVEYYWEDLTKNEGASWSKPDDACEEATTSEEKSAKYIQSPKKNTKKSTASTNLSSTHNINASKQTSRNFRSYKKESTLPVSSQNLDANSTRKKEETKQLHKILLGKLKPYHVFLDMGVLKKQSPYITPIHSEVYGHTSLWLFKPSDLNRGRGIHLFRSIEELGDLLKAELSRHEKGTFIVQKYIEKPLLISNRKFDIRMYGMVTQNKEYYFFKEGYIRTSSIKYDIHSKNYYTHLTNNAIQKYSKTYGEFEEGNILPLEYLFKECGIDRASFYKEIKKKIKLTFKASHSKLFVFPEKLVSTPLLSYQNIGPSHHSNPSNVTGNLGMVHGNSASNNRVKYFEIFGYDFMLDCDMNSWLIEVNTNPCIELSNAWLKKIIPRMLDDAFKLTVDRIFPKGRQLKSDVLDIKEEEEVDYKGIRSSPKFERLGGRQKYGKEMNPLESSCATKDRKRIQNNEERINPEESLQPPSAKGSPKENQGDQFEYDEEIKNKAIHKDSIWESATPSSRKGTARCSFYKRFYRVEGYKDTENMWEYLDLMADELTEIENSAMSLTIGKGDQSEKDLRKGERFGGSQKL